MEEPLRKPAYLYDASNTLVMDCLIPISEKRIELLTVDDRYFVYDVLTDTYKEGMRYHISQMNN